MLLQTKIQKSSDIAYFPRHFHQLLDFCKNIDQIPDLFFREQKSFRRYCVVFSKYDKNSNHKFVGVTKQGSIAVGSDNTDSYGNKVNFMPFEKFLQQEQKTKSWRSEDFVAKDLSRLLHKIDVSEITAISNQEVRREAIKRIGIDNLLSKIDNKILDKNEKGEILFDLFKNDIDFDFGDGKERMGRFMYVRDGTRKDHFYMLEVPTVWIPGRGEPIKNNLEVTNIQIAKAWSFKIHPTKYFPEVET